MTREQQAQLKGYKADKDGRVFGKKGIRKLRVRTRSNGYTTVTFTIRIEGKVKHVSVSRLQAYQKFGNELFKKDIVVRHLDGNPTNNAWDNIAIGTHSDNMMDIPKQKRREMASSPKKYNHISIIRDRRKGMTYKELMDKHNISSKGTIGFILNKSLVSETI